MKAPDTNEMLERLGVYTLDGKLLSECSYKELTDALAKECSRVDTHRTRWEQWLEKALYWHSKKYHD